MITSNEIAQIMASQSNMFSGQDAYAQQIGVASPPMAGGMFPQQYGTMLPQAGGVMPQPNMYGGAGMYPVQQQAPQYNYAPPPLPQFLRPQAPYQPNHYGMFGPSMGPGNQVAGTAFSGMSGAVTAAGAATTALGVFGKLPAAADLSGWSMASSAFSAARAGGMGMLGAGAIGAVTGLPFAAAGMYGGKAVDSFIEGGRGQQQLNNALQSNFQHYNPMARGGAGFTREDSSAIGSRMRQLEYLPEMMTNMEEMTQKILPKLKAAGVMQGAKDAGEFAKKFKEALTTISDISRVLGTSMADAQKFFEHSRSVGFLGRRDQLQNLVNMKYTAGQTGSTVEEIGALQQEGAGMARSFGARGKLGAEAIMSNVNMTQNALDQGNLREGFLEDYTGQSGAAGVRAASTRITGLMSAAAMNPNFAVGRGMMLGMMKLDENGRPVLREDVAEKFKRGEVTKQYLEEQFNKMTEGEKTAFAAHPEDMAAQFAKLGTKGLYKFAETITPGGSQDPNKVILSLRKVLGGTGATERDIEFLKAAGETRETDALDRRGYVDRQMQEMKIRERTDISGNLTKAWKKKKEEWFGDYTEMGAKAYNKIGSYAEDKLDETLHRATLRPSKRIQDNIEEAMAGSEDAMGELTGGLSGTERKQVSLADADEWTVDSKMAGWIGRGTGRTAKGDLVETLESLGITGTDDASIKAGQTELERLRRAGQSDGFSAQRVAMGNIMGDLDKRGAFREAGGRGKIEQIKEYLEETQSLETASRAGGVMTPEMQKRIKNMQVIRASGMTNESAAHAFGGEEVETDLFNMKDTALGAMSIEATAKDLNEKKRALANDAPNAFAMMTGGKGDLFKAATKDAETRNKIQSIIRRNKDDPEKAAKLIEAATGKKVSSADVPLLDGALREHAENDDLGDKVNVFESAEKVAGQEVSRLAAGRMASGIKNVEGTSSLTGLRDALKLAGDVTSRTAGQYKGDVKQIGEAIEKYSAELVNADEDTQRKLIEGGDEIGSMAGRALESSKGVRAGMKAEQIAKKMGISVKEAEAIISGDKGDKEGRFSKETISKLVSKSTARLAGKGMSGDQVSTGGFETDQTKDLQGTLQGLNATLGRLNDTLAHKNGDGKDPVRPQAAAQANSPSGGFRAPWNNPDLKWSLNPSAKPV